MALSTICPRLKNFPCKRRARGGVERERERKSDSLSSLFSAFGWTLEGGEKGASSLLLLHFQTQILQDKEEEEEDAISGICAHRTHYGTPPQQQE